MLVAAVATLLTAGALDTAVTPAGAQTAPTEDASVATLRAEADALATRYFAALGRAEELDAEAERTAAEVDDLEASAERARIAARDRALVAYRQSGSRLGTVMEGDDLLDSARRARLIDQVNERDHATYDRLRDVSKALRARRQELESVRAEQAAGLDELRAQGAAIDARLARAAQREAEALQAAAGASSPSPAAGAPAPAATTAAPGAAPTAAPVPTPTPPPPATPPPPVYSGTPGVHPHHDDPFLTCVRARESSGRYGAVNPAGPYLGAYQFLQSTWNAAANHAGRRELVGVPPNLATPYDQDDMAWALYQWQGAGPWGGACS